MQFGTFTLLFVVTIASLPTKSNAQILTRLFNIFLRPVVPRACDLAQKTLGLESIATCECDLEYVGIFQGLTGGVGCTTSEERCLVPPDKFCATGTVDFALKAGVFVDTGFNSNITACFKVKSGFPTGIVSLAEDICFEFSTKGLGFDACTVTIGTGTCQKCEICDSGTDFKFDCANIDLETSSNEITINGPTITDCIGLSAVPIPTNITL
jgi:hypothetical protein